MNYKRFLLTIGALILVAMALGAVAVYVGVTYNKDRAAEQLNTCHKVNLVQSEIKTTLQRSKKTIPTLAYYKEHPAELQKALDTIDGQLTVFSPLKC